MPEPQCPHGVARQTIHNDILTLGIGRHSRDENITAARIDDVDRLTKQGLSAAEISVRLGCSQRQVQRDRAALRATRAAERWSA